MGQPDQELSGPRRLAGGDGADRCSPISWSSAFRRPSASSLSSQMRRAAVSVPVERRRGTQLAAPTAATSVTCRIALGSLGELETRARDRPTARLHHDSSTAMPSSSSRAQDSCSTASPAAFVEDGSNVSVSRLSLLRCSCAESCCLSDRARLSLLAVLFARPAISTPGCVSLAHERSPHGVPRPVDVSAARTRTADHGPRTANREPRPTAYTEALP